MIQIVGTKKSRETAQAIRFCKERSIAFQFVDLRARSLSSGEWESIFAAIEAEELIDTSSRYYKKEGYSYRLYDPRQELIAHPELLRLPILRFRGVAVVGFDEEVILAWRKNDA